MTNRKGEHRLLPTFFVDAFFIAVMLLSLYMVTNRFLDKSTDYQDLQTKDLAITLDLIHAAPGDLELPYAHQQPYLTMIEEGKVTLGRPRTIKEIENNPSSEDYTYLSFQYGRSPITVEAVTLSAQAFIITKKEDTITTSTDQSVIITTCPTEKLLPTSFRITGPSQSTNDEYGMLFLLVESVKAGLQERGFEVRDDGRTHISIGFGQRLITHDENEQLACYTHRFIKELLEEDFPYEQVSGPALRIELGSKEDFDLESREHLADAIIRATAAAYGQ